MKGRAAWLRIGLELWFGLGLRFGFGFGFGFGFLKGSAACSCLGTMSGLKRRGLRSTGLYLVRVEARVEVRPGWR